MYRFRHNVNSWAESQEKLSTKKTFHQGVPNPAKRCNRKSVFKVLLWSLTSWMWQKHLTSELSRFLISNLGCTNHPNCLFICEGIVALLFSSFRHPGNSMLFQLETMASRKFKSFFFFFNLVSILGGYQAAPTKTKNRSQWRRFMSCISSNGHLRLVSKTNKHNVNSHVEMSKFETLKNNFAVSYFLSFI